MNAERDVHEDPDCWKCGTNLFVTGCPGHDWTWRCQNCDFGFEAMNDKAQQLYEMTNWNVGEQSYLLDARGRILLDPNDEKVPVECFTGIVVHDGELKPVKDGNRDMTNPTHESVSVDDYEDVEEMVSSEITDLRVTGPGRCPDCGKRVETKYGPIDFTGTMFSNGDYVCESCAIDRGVTA